MEDFYERVLNVLRSEPRFFAEDGTFLRNAVYEAAMQMDAGLLRLLLGDLDGRATHSEMARDFLEVRLFGVLELGGAGEPVAGARALLLGVVNTATMVKEVLNSHWLRGSLTAS